VFGIGETELLIIVAFGFMIFGPDKLPGMGRTIGRALRQFRQAQEGFTEVVQSEVMDPLQEAMGDPLDTGTRKKHRATAEERAAAMAADADIDAPEAAPARKETFAERKARLAAERKAREEEELARAQEEDADAPEGAEEAEPEAEEQTETVEQPAANSAAALYSMGGGSSFAANKRAAAEAAATEAAEKAAEKEAAEAAAPEEPEVAEAATEAAVEDLTDGKEDEGAQA
jgi:TatA/E family protein of Tat protein translocase